MKTVLIIEDNPAVLKTIADILSTEDLKLALATNGEEGLDFAMKLIPDLILCDITLPGITGYDILRQIRSNSLTSRIPLIFLTALVERSEMRKGMELGANDYITKPFNTAELLKAVKLRLQMEDEIEQQRQESLKQLSSNIVYALPHELRTPLMHVLGYADLLILDHETVSRDQIQGWGQQIRKAGERLQGLVENYLIYIQIETLLADPIRSKKIREQRVQNADQIIENHALILATETNRQQDIRLNLENATLKISQSDLQKVIEEVLSNALKFSNPETAISVIGKCEKDLYELRIRDFGRGMSKEMVNRMGEYMQFQRDLYEQQGVGLGFVIAQKLLQLYQGNLHIESHPDQGTLVTLTIPIDHD